MKKYPVVGLIIFVSYSLWYFFPSKHDQLMSHALKELQLHPEIKEFDGQIEPEFPDKNENDETLLGLDKNQNGIRDDIDIWINRSAIDSSERQALRRYAFALQNQIKNCDLKKSQGTAPEVREAANLLAVVSDSKRIKGFAERAINELTFTTSARKKCL